MTELSLPEDMDTSLAYLIAALRNSDKPSSHAAEIGIELGGLVYLLETMAKGGNFSSSLSSEERRQRLARSYCLQLLAQWVFEKAMEWTEELPSDLTPTKVLEQRGDCLLSLAQLCDSIEAFETVTR